MHLFIHLYACSSFNDRVMLYHVVRYLPLVSPYTCMFVFMFMLNNVYPLCQQIGISLNRLNPKPLNPQPFVAPRPSQRAAAKRGHLSLAALAWTMFS